MRAWHSIMGVTAAAAVAAAVVFGAAGGREKAIYWSAADGASAAKEASAVGRQWKSAGHENGFGYPTIELSAEAVVSADGVPVTPERGGLRSSGVYQEF